MMSDVTEQRMCDEPFGSDEEGEEADVESYLEDNSSELMDRLRELEVEEILIQTAVDDSSMSMSIHMPDGREGFSQPWNPV